MAFKNQINALSIAGLSATLFNNTYQQLSTGIAHPCYLLRITNDSDQDVFVSFNGSTGHEFIAAGKTVDFTAPAVSPGVSGVAYFGKGTPVYIKGASAGTGYVYLSGFYQKSN